MIVISLKKCYKGSDFLMEEIDIKDFLGYLKKFLIPMIIVALILATGASIFYNLSNKNTDV